LERAETYVDGASRGNPGPAGIGVVIKADGKVFKIAEYVGTRTNNQAEYLALIKALTKLRELDVRKVYVYSDSVLLVKQVNGEYRVRHPELKTLHEKVRELVASFEDFHIIHVDREKNREADRLANEAIESR